MISASHIIGKLTYRELCDQKFPWVEKIPNILKRKFKKWVQDICTNKTEIPWAIPLKLECVTAIDLHVFDDGSILANCVAVYAVVNQPSIISKGLLVSKTRLSKNDLTIPRLELVSAHMVSNLVTNVMSALQRENIRSVVGWTDRQYSCFMLVKPV